MPRANEPGRSVSSRLWDLLFAFDPDHVELSLADLVRRTGMPHATTRRLTLELVEVGALERNSANKFTIGLPLWRLGTLAPRAETLRSVAQPFIEDLYVALRQHVQLAVLQHDHAVIIERLSAVSAVRLESQVGGQLPLHCSGVGKVLLSHSSSAFVDEVLSRRLPAFTPHTKIEPDALRRELADCRTTGIVVAREELTAGADSVATRIVDGRGTVVAALSVVVATGSINLQAVIPSLVASGLGLSRSLGWRPGIPVRSG